MSRKIVFLFLFGFFSAAVLAQKSERILVASASDLKFALDSVVVAFKKHDPRSVVVTYGASGKLFEQIQNGAPFDLYFSADIKYPELLKERGFSASEVYPYGIGHLVLWSRRLDPSREGMKTLLSPSVRKVAIANPEHAPYGRAAREALIHHGMLDAVQARLVIGENISQTAQFATTGAADVGIIALSLTLSPTMQKLGGNYWQIPTSSHQPLLQGTIVTKRAASNELARAFFDFVKGAEAQAILAYFGFTKP